MHTQSQEAREKEIPCFTLQGGVSVRVHFADEDNDAALCAIRTILLKTTLQATKEGQE